MQDQQVTSTQWPFKYVNGHQTPQSKALMALRAGQSDKGQHKPSGAITPKDLTDIEDAPW